MVSYRALQRLLEGVHATTAGRRRRIEADAGGAFVFEVRIDSDLVWHVYWDYASRNRDGIVLIALIELEV